MLHRIIRFLAGRNNGLRNISEAATAKVGVRINLYNWTKHSTAQSYVEDGLTPEQVQIVLGSKSMNTVRQYTDLDKIEIRRALLDKVVQIRKVEEK